MEELSETLHEYTVTPGQVDASGIKYEINMATLLYLRATKNNYQFLLATGVKAAGKFDDVVLEYHDGTKIKTVLIQLKHKQRKPVKYSDFLSATNTNNDFSLIKYYKSYCEIRSSFLEKKGIKWRGKFEDFKFVLCTNAQLNSSRIHLIPNDICEFDLLMTGGKILYLASNQSLKNEFIEKCTEKSNLQYMDEFMKQIVIIVGQANQKELNLILKQEIQEIYRLSEYGASRELKYLKEQMHLWWENNNTIKTSIKENMFSIQTVNEIVRKVSKNESQLGNIDIEFREEIVTQMKDLLNGTEKLIYITTQNISVKLACLKLLQGLKKVTEIPLYITTEMLQDNDCLNNILNIWPSLWCKYLIVIVENYKSNKMIDIIDMLKRLMKNITNEQDCKIIIISSNIFEEQLKLHIPVHDIKTVAITMELCEITETSKNILLDKKLNFQGRFITLNDLRNLDYNICSNLISDLVSSETIELGKPILPPEKYFIDRCLMRKCYIKPSILFSGPTEIIAVSGSDESKLQEFLQEQYKATKIIYPIIKELTKNRIYKKLQKKFTFMFPTNQTIKNEEIFSKSKCYSPVHIIKTIEDYRVLCKEKCNVHWLELKDERLRWKHTYGDITAIQKNCEDEHCSYGVTSMWDIPDRIVLITANCGMGKSTLMQAVAHNTKISSPTKFVIKINLNDCTHFLALIDSKKITNSDVSNFLLLNEDVKNKNSYKSTILRSLLEHPEKCVLLIDSFDEVMPRYESVVMPLLSKICEIKFEKVWITSRIIFTHELERLLQVLSFSIKPLNEYDQYKFFTEYCKNKEVSTDFERLNNFTKQVSEMNNDKTFFGVPLYCKMVADVHKNLVYENSTKGELPKLILVNVCDQFIEQTFSSYCAKYNIDMHDTKTEIGEMIRERRKKFYENHMMASLTIFFTSKEISKIKNMEKISETLLNLQLEEKTGFINSIKNGRPQFTHNIFVEYFVAKFVTENISECQELIKYLYKNPRFSVVTNFIDHIILKSEPLHVAVITSDVECVKRLLQSEKHKTDKFDMFGRTPLHLALSYLNTFSGDCRTYKIQIVKELLQCGANVNIADSVLKSSPFYYACVSIFRWRILAVIYEYGNITKSNIKFLIKLIKKERDYKDLYLVFKEGYVKFGDFFITHAKYMECLRDSLIHKATLEGDLNMLKILLYHKLFKYDDNYKNEILFTATKIGHTHIVEYLTSEHHLNQYIVLSGQLSHRPRQQHEAIARRVERIKHYQETKNTDVNLVINNCGDDILFIVDSIDCVKYLVDICKLNPRIPDHYGRLPIHVASGNNFPDIVQYYLETSNIDCNVTDKNGNAPLHHACMSAWDGNINVVKLLVDSYMVNINLKNNAGATPFLITSSEPGSVETMKYLKENGVADVFATDSLGNTALHCSMYYGDIDIVKYLIEICKINPLIRNNAEKTALELLVSNENSNTLLSKDAIKYLNEIEKLLK